MTTREKYNTRLRVLLLCAVSLWCLCVQAQAQTQKNQRWEQEESATEPLPLQSEPEQAEIFLYFVHPDKRHLTAKPVYFPADPDEYSLGVKILTTLLKGPQDKSLTSAWPKGTTLRAFFMGENGQAWVDLILEKDARGRQPFAQTDTFEEILAVYSLTHSLCLNLTQVDTVKILVNGSEKQSLGGHLNLEYFYTPNMALVK